MIEQKKPIDQLPKELAPFAGEQQRRIIPQKRYGVSVSQSRRVRVATFFAIAKQRYRTASRKPNFGTSGDCFHL